MALVGHIRIYAYAIRTLGYAIRIYAITYECMQDTNGTFVHSSTHSRFFGYCEAECFVKTSGADLTCDDMKDSEGRQR